ncbi:MAG TPA: excisionase [Chloroflexota bacterium]|nr:excisionase [Chloroflexota bacterium]
MLDVETFRSRLGVSHHKVWKLIGSGQLLTIKLEGRRYVPRSELHDFPRRVLGRQAGAA